jgi:hypothetical protein
MQGLRLGRQRSTSPRSLYFIDRLDLDAFDAGVWRAVAKLFVSEVVVTKTAAVGAVSLAVRLKSA